MSGFKTQVYGFGMSEENNIFQISERNKSLTLPLIDFEGVVLCVAVFRMQNYYTQSTKTSSSSQPFGETLCNVL
jgi:hypothetical protein